MTVGWTYVAMGWTFMSMAMGWTYVTFRWVYVQKLSLPQVKECNDTPSTFCLFGVTTIFLTECSVL